MQSSELDNLGYSFVEKPTDAKIIKVIGVGGGGSNAVNHMFNHGNIKDVDYLVCNTDKQALGRSKVPSKILLGRQKTEGLGAGGDPTMGEESAKEVEASIREQLENGTKMVFITVGMGGGTGTGAGPVVAAIAKSLDILTVGIVTMPFDYEGREKRQLAMAGIVKMSKVCDTMLVIMNDKIFEEFPDSTIEEAFLGVDEVLLKAAKSIAEIITVEQDQNMDFKDVQRVLKESGSAVMGTSISSADNRAEIAVEAALNSPLLYNMDINGAKNILISVVHGSNGIKVTETKTITRIIEEKTKSHPYIKLGYKKDVDIPENELRITIVATGFSSNLKQIADLLDINVDDADIDEINKTHSNNNISSHEILVEPSIENTIEEEPEPVEYNEPEIKHEEPISHQQAQPAEPKRPPTFIPKAPETIIDKAKVTVVEPNGQLGIGGVDEIFNHPENVVSYKSDSTRLSSEDRIKEYKARLEEKKKPIDFNPTKYEVPPAQRRVSTQDAVSPTQQSEPSTVSFNDQSEIKRENRRYRDSVD